MDNINLVAFLAYPQNVLTLMGIWPRSDWKLGWLYNVYGFLMTFVVSYTFMIVLSGGIYEVLDNFEETADASYYAITHLTFIIKFTTFVTRRKKFLRLLQSMKEPVFTQHLQEQENYQSEFLQFTKTYMKGYYICCSFVWIFYGLYPIFEQTNTAGLPMKTWSLLDVEHSTFCYFVEYLYQMLALGVAIGTNASYDVLTSALMNSACVEIQILKDNLQNATRRTKKAFGKTEENEEEAIELLSKEEDDFVFKEIVKSIEHHKAIRRFLLDMQEIFGFGMFFQFISGGTIICILGLEITVLPTNLKFAMTLFYFMAMVSQNTLFCWNGNQVIVESMDIAESCYKMDWYRCSPKVKRTLFILMERSKIPLKVMAGNFFDLTLGTLTMILRSSYSYFAVLQQLYNN